MDKIVQYLFLILLPFYPFWAWLFFTYTKKPVGIFAVLALIPIAIYYVITQRIKIPKYLVFLIFFTIYHLSSVLSNHLVPADTNLLFFLLADIYVFASLMFIVIESTNFDEIFITRMNRLIFIIVIISCIVSLIQIKDPSFFVNPDVVRGMEGGSYLSNRNFSIYSWINMNSNGISFPILISILLSVPNFKKSSVPFIIMSGILVSFLTRARYVMISAIIVMSQLFFGSKIVFRKKIYILLLISSIVIVLFMAANIYGFNIRQVIEGRILEKGSGMESARARITSYEVFVLKFPENPLFGVGPETRMDVLRLLNGIPLIHVGYLSYLYFYGIFGFLLLFLSLFYLLRYAWLTGRKYAFWGSFYGLFSFCFANLTFVYFNLGEMGIVLAVIYMKYFNEKPSLELTE